MHSFFSKLARRRFPYEPLIRVEISKERLIHNLNEFKKLAPGGLVAPVLKSNAYGHGLIEVAGILAHQSDVPFFVVDSYFEAISLRARGIRTPVLVIGYTPAETIAQARTIHTMFTVTSLDALKSLPRSIHSLRIHLKIDTGMRRQGILVSEIPEAIEVIKKNPSISLEGICSHLADADNTDVSFTKDQIKTWNESTARFTSAFPSIKYIHLSNTDGHRFPADITANVSRLGIGLYGLTEGVTINASLDLKPVLQMKTVISGVKKLAQGEPTGYSATFTAKGDMTIATIPVGYYEGIDRRLSSDSQGKPRAFVLVGPNNIPCPIVGRVSMNISTIDISNVPDAKLGMNVTVFKDDSSSPASIAAAAKTCGTITYEVAVKIPAHLKRAVV